MFSRNEGPMDRAIRAILGIAIIAIGIYYKSWWGAIGLVPLVTAITGFCGLYKVLGISTLPKAGTVVEKSEKESEDDRPTEEIPAEAPKNE